MSALPPVEQISILRMRFTDKAEPRLISLVQERLEAGGMIVLERKKSGKFEEIGLTTKQETLEAEAESIRLLKRTTKTQIMDYFTVLARAKFCDKTQRGRDPSGLFTSNDRSLLMSRILDDIDVLETGQDTSSLSRLLDEYHVDYARVDGSGRRVLLEHAPRSVSLQHVLLTYELVEFVTPEHIPGIRDEVVKETMTWYRLSPPCDLIRDYYGDEIAFYFSWMGYLTKWLVFPGVFGCTMFASRLYRNVSIDDDRYIPFYGIGIFLWAILFLRFWEREENRKSYAWGTFSLADHEKHKFFAQRPQFRGYLRQSPTTGEMEIWYPDFYRGCKYVGSAVVTVSMLWIAFSVMILSLNLQGYINPKRNPLRWTEGNPHPFHYPALSSWAEEGQPFDAMSSWKSLLPVVLHAASIFSMNNIYRRIAVRLTDWENHENQISYRNSLVLKRFLFEAFDCYVALFYLAFYERDVLRLRLELVAVFNVDTFRRLLLECLVPMVWQRASHELEEYEQFDDYMEVVIQLGYVTLFASAYPLASMIAIVANWVEIRADMFKLCYLCRRPRSFRCDGLGMWRTLQASLIWMSALTNCLIVGFTSDQLMQYLPEFYIEDERGHTYYKPGKGWITVFIIFGLERVLLVVGILIHLMVPAVAEDTVGEVEKQHYIRSKVREEKERKQD